MSGENPSLSARIPASARLPSSPGLELQAATSKDWMGGLHFAMPDLTSPMGIPSCDLRDLGKMPAMPTMAMPLQMPNMPGIFRVRRGVVSVTKVTRRTATSD